MRVLSLFPLERALRAAFAFSGSYGPGHEVVAHASGSAVNVINVHIVPHTHDDVGWLKNVNQYLLHENNTIQDAGVSLILDSVLSELVVDDEEPPWSASQAQAQGVAPGKKLNTAAGGPRPRPAKFFQQGGGATTSTVGGDAPEVAASQHHKHGVDLRAKRNFQYVEQAFFQRWYANQPEEKRQKLKSLVRQKKWRFLNGGWVMHDEACAHFLDMIDQTSLGHSFLLKEFGVRPRVGWQLDPFGHSILQVDLMGAELGFEGLFFGRIDFQDLEYRVSGENGLRKAAEFVWKSDHNDYAKLPSAGARRRSSWRSSSEVFTGLTGSYGGNYGPPMHYWWDELCDVESNPTFESTAGNKTAQAEIVDNFYTLVLQQANVTRGRNILMTWGSDFWYSNATKVFWNTDELIRRVNAKYGSEMSLFYSNMEDYVAAKKMEEEQAAGVEVDENERILEEDGATNKPPPSTGSRRTSPTPPSSSSPALFPTKQNTDFFPYADRPHGYWTGYFSSRPALKRMIREFSNYFQIFKTFAALSGVKNPKLLNFADAMGIAQHHDAVTGTEKQHVTFDYQKRLHAGYMSAAKIALGAETIGKLAGLGGGRKPEETSADSLPWQNCLLRNESRCDVTLPQSTSTMTWAPALTDADTSVHFKQERNRKQTPDITMLIWNQLPRARDSVRVEVPVDSRTKQVFCDGYAIDVDFFSVGEFAPGNYHEEVKEGAWFLSFKVGLPALGFRKCVLAEMMPEDHDVSTTSELDRNRWTPSGALEQEHLEAEQTLQSSSSVVPVTTFHIHPPESDRRGLQPQRQHLEDIIRDERDADQTPRPQMISLVLRNEYLQLTFCEDTGEICEIANVKTGQKLTARQRYKTYLGIGNNTEQNTGAYIFRPRNETGSVPFEFLRVEKIQFHRADTDVGNDEVRQVYAGGFVRQRIRLVGERIEITHISGPLPEAIELATSWETGIANQQITTGQKRANVFYTDANGRQMMRRATDAGRDYPTWNTTRGGEPIAGNYYPVVAAISIQDENGNAAGRTRRTAETTSSRRDSNRRTRAFTILTDAAQGGTSLHEGHVELMTHRSCDYDDARGVGEPLNETQFVFPYDNATPQEAWGKHYGPRLRAIGEHWVVIDWGGVAAARGSLAAEEDAQHETNSDRAPAEKVEVEEPTDSDTVAAWRAAQDEMYAKPLVLFQVQGEAPASSLIAAPRARSRASSDTDHDEDIYYKRGAARAPAGADEKENPPGGLVRRERELPSKSKTTSWDPALQLLTLEPIDAEHVARILLSSPAKRLPPEETKLSSRPRPRPASGSSGEREQNGAASALSYLLRIGHNGMSHATKNIDVASFFRDRVTLLAGNIAISFTELNLSANQRREDMPTWRREKTLIMDATMGRAASFANKRINRGIVSLVAGQIRTFVIQFQTQHEKNENIRGRIVAPLVEKEIIDNDNDHTGFIFQ
mmetsp:Transcript_8010/g.19258  ORF Transcript_8010/g.19258 Transcript_8010/m.19258 type:complete len:1447 (-) Transcript_8010:53-4393(-)|eukprot:CAMPEP_0178985078 /NCGR_PEP_ID=MMETSP0795-20121207/1959_1 /TAXON_ID=88552 /ORGANISM="Amoebophrya sp., Strain Ameob2" /LENGTH=1446 /DNA_ID=CAMNT_0020676009 /DNA_START=239 /DNA_END=4579 /DNA_ORIENTATION=-